MMNSRERFYSMLEYKGLDRAPTLYHGTPEINSRLMDYFGVADFEALQEKLGDDFRYVSARYKGPELGKFPDGSWEGLWGERYAYVDFGSGAYPEAVFLPYKDVMEPEELERFRFPSPDWFDYSGIKEACEKMDGSVVCTGDAGTPDFINGIARCRGVEQVLVDIATEEPVYLALMEKRFEFFYGLYRRIFEAGEGLIDVFSMGEDLGNQNGLMISPKTFDRLFAPKLEAFFDLAHSCGVKTMLHCCGSCKELIPRFIELGLDILDVVQVDAAGMDIDSLHREFYGKIAFCGSISVQSTLPFGTPADVEKEVEIRKQLFRDGGMIIAPTHGIQAGTPLENILAIYRSVGSLPVR